jgi:hypothetical protein
MVKGRRILPRRLFASLRIPTIEGQPTGPVKFGFYFRFGAKDWFGKAEAGGINISYRVTRQIGDRPPGCFR